METPDKGILRMDEPSKTQPQPKATQCRCSCCRERRREHQQHHRHHHRHQQQQQQQQQQQIHQGSAASSSNEENAAGISPAPVDWAVTLYDFDGRGKITRQDMSTLVRTLTEAMDRHNLTSCFGGAAGTRDAANHAATTSASSQATSAVCRLRLKFVPACGAASSSSNADAGIGTSVSQQMEAPQPCCQRDHYRRHRHRQGHLEDSLPDPAESFNEDHESWSFWRRSKRRSRQPPPPPPPSPPQQQQQHQLPRPHHLRSQHQLQQSSVSQAERSLAAMQAVAEWLHASPTTHDDVDASLQHPQQQQLGPQQSQVMRHQHRHVHRHHHHFHYHHYYD